MNKLFSKSILTPIAQTAYNISHWLSDLSQDRDNGVMVVHCMDARINLRGIIKPHLTVPNALTPAGAIVDAADLSVAKRFEVARGRFAMRDILIMGHQNCAAMGQLTNVLIGRNQDPYYANFLISGQGFPQIDLSDYISGGRKIVPNFTDNLAVLTALHSARNVLAYNVCGVENPQTIADLVNSGEVRIHIGYTGLDQARDNRWTESHYLLSRDGADLVRTPNIAQTIINQRPQATVSFMQLLAQIQTAQTSFSDRLCSSRSPTEMRRA